MCKARPGHLQVDWEPSRSRAHGRLGRGARAQACVGGNRSEVDNPCEGLRKRNAPARTMGRATGARLRREGEVGHGNPACGGAGSPASLGDAGDLWGQVGWMMVAPGEAHGGLWPRALPLGTYNKKKEEKPWVRESHR